MTLYIVKYKGAFGFIKPWTAVRDAETFTQQFLTPSIIEGIEKKLFPELIENVGLSGAIVAHRLTYSGIDRQQEQTQPRSIKMQSRAQVVKIERPRAILVRGVMIDPVVFLAFSTKEYAERAMVQHICLCRNEDVLLPIGDIRECSQEEFDTEDNGFNGFELRFTQGDNSFLVGYNRFENIDNKPAPMYGELHIVGKPIYHSLEHYNE
ncbi:MAG TPA: hypothetical protein PLW09_10645 [Candidatus Kapabacteria bacterium]|nr:hypothetical protein [Ignavibacteria bacterium]HRE58267.1 hypothetical protein [Candidatus Kapabacteria bacterium]HRI30701.1 hypothetical protein [Candidatus Kapabacteria bacterium]